MKSREEILRRIKHANSWRETGLTTKEVYEAFASDSSHVNNDEIQEHGVNEERLKTGLKSDRVGSKKSKGGSDK